MRQRPVIHWRLLNWKLAQLPSHWPWRDGREVLTFELPWMDTCLSCEAAPLPSFSPEKHEDLIPLLPQLQTLLSGVDFPADTTLPQLCDAFLMLQAREDWNSLPASLRFAAEASLWKHVLKPQKQPLESCLLLDTAPESWSSILPLDAACVKIKLGRVEAARERQGLAGLADRVSQGLELRLDCNHGWTRRELELAVAECPRPVWIEDPLQDSAEADGWLAEWQAGRDWQLAQDLRPDCSPIQHAALAALVLKPQLLGLGGCLKEMARRPDLDHVLSSCYESPEQKTVMVDIAKQLMPHRLPGLGTFSLFSGEVELLAEGELE